MPDLGIGQQELIRMGIISGLFISIFVIAEVLRITIKPKVEVTRKFVHFFGGMVTLSFSYVFNTHWAVLLMCIGFVGILFGSKKMNMLKSVHGIDRPSSGGIFFPLAVYFTWVFAHYYHQPDYYLIGLLILSISDSMAALVGTNYGRFLFLVEKERKSIEGTVMFFLITFLITEQGMLHLTEVGAVKASLCGVYVAILVTGFELLSLKGSDNLFIPIGTVYILIRYPKQSVDEMVFQLFLLIAILVSFIATGKWTKVFGFSGLVGIGLMAYGAWALVEFPWFIPVLTGFFLANFGHWFKPIQDKDYEKLRIRTVFYLVAIMFIWILIVNLFLDFQSYFIVPYLFSFISVMDLLWRRRIKLTKNMNEPKKASSEPPQWLRLVILYVIFYPIQLYFYPNLQLVSAAIVVIPMAYVYTILTEKVYSKFKNSYISMDVMRYNLMISFVVSFLVMAMYYGIIQVLTV